MDPGFQTQVLGESLPHTAATFNFDFDATQADYGGTQSNYTQVKTGASPDTSGPVVRLTALICSLNAGLRTWWRHLG